MKKNILLNVGILAGVFLLFNSFKKANKKVKEIPPEILITQEVEALERYLQKLSEAGFTSVVIIQDEENSVHGDKKKHIVRRAR